MWKHHPGEKGFLIWKREISFLKNVPPGWDGIIFVHIIANVFFNRKDYLNGISSKNPVSAKRDKFPHILPLSNKLARSVATRT